MRKWKKMKRLRWRGKENEEAEEDIHVHVGVEVRIKNMKTIPVFYKRLHKNKELKKI